MLTNHALKRTAQRGITSEICDLLISYGDRKYDGHGGVVRYFSKQALREIAGEKGLDYCKRNYEKFRTYLVESSRDGDVITAAKDHGRSIRRVFGAL